MQVCSLVFLVNYNIGIIKRQGDASQVLWYNELHECKKYHDTGDDVRGWEKSDNGGTLPYIHEKRLKGRAVQVTEYGFKFICDS